MFKSLKRKWACKAMIHNWWAAKQLKDILLCLLIDVIYKINMEVCTNFALQIYSSNKRCMKSSSWLHRNKLKQNENEIIIIIVYHIRVHCKCLLFTCISRVNSLIIEKDSGYQLIHVQWKHAWNRAVFNLYINNLMRSDGVGMKLGSLLTI